jgi:hypothetical protein
MRPRLTPHRRRLLSTALTMLAWGAIVFVWLALNFSQKDYFQDARAYHGFDFANLYGQGAVGGREAYLYSPAFAQAMAPFGLLPWPVFKLLWSGLNLAALAWLAGPRLGALVLLVPFSPVANEIGTGNLHLLLAAAVVLAFRHPAWWALALLTKVTPGVGLLWFVGRREWRSLALAAGATAAIAVVSLVIAPQLWIDWFETLTRSGSVAIPAAMVGVPGPFLARLIVAAGLALGGGLIGWRWTVPVAAMVALPVPWTGALSMLLGVVALWRHRLPDGERSTVRVQEPDASGQRPVSQRGTP